MPDAPISEAEAFKLHSRPNATLKIMLDFDGHTTTGTAWNTAHLMPTITSKAYDKVSAGPAQQSETDTQGLSLSRKLRAASPCMQCSSSECVAG